MASALKRKRGSVEVLDTPKRSKSVKGETPNPLQKLGAEKVGWEAAFGDLQSKKELVQTNGNHGDDSDSEEEQSDSSEALDYEAIQENGTLAEGLDAPTRKRALKGQERSKTWKLSESIGGRMINADPAFTADEKYVHCCLLISGMLLTYNFTCRHLIIASRTTIHVYSTSTLR